MTRFSTRPLRLALYSREKTLRRKIRNFAKVFSRDFTLIEDIENLKPAELGKARNDIDYLLLPPRVAGALGNSALRYFSALAGRDRFPVRIIILGGGERDAHIRLASFVGASGCLSISDAPARFASSLLELNEAGCSFLVHRSPLPRELQLHTLSPRETQTLHLAAKGHSPDEVARILDISKFAVKFHLRSAFAKSGNDVLSKHLRVTSRAESKTSGSR